MSVDARYSHRNAANLLQPVQMHLSQKLKILWKYFIPVLESTSNFRYLEKKIRPHGLSITEISHSEKSG